MPARRHGVRAGGRVRGRRSAGRAKLVEPGAAERAARRVRGGVVPVMRARPGFRLHLSLVGEAREALGATLSDDRAAALAALGRLLAPAPRRSGPAPAGGRAFPDS